MEQDELGSPAAEEAEETVASLLRLSKSRYLNAVQVNFLMTTVALPLSMAPPACLTIGDGQGALFMYDRRQCKKFREDGIHYCTRANGKTLNESHERFRVPGVEDTLLNVYYASSADGTIMRRIFWRTFLPKGSTTSGKGGRGSVRPQTCAGSVRDDMVLVHYLSRTDAAASISEHTSRTRNGRGEVLIDPTAPMRAAAEKAAEKAAAAEQAAAGEEGEGAATAACGAGVGLTASMVSGRPARAAGILGRLRKRRASCEVGDAAALEGIAEPGSPARRTSSGCVTPRASVDVAGGPFAAGKRLSGAAGGLGALGSAAELDGSEAQQLSRRASLSYMGAVALGLGSPLKQELTQHQLQLLQQQGMPQLQVRVKLEAGERTPTSTSSLPSSPMIGSARASSRLASIRPPALPHSPTQLIKSRMSQTLVQMEESTQVGQLPCQPKRTYLLSAAAPGPAAVPAGSEGDEEEGEEGAWPLQHLPLSSWRGGLPASDPTGQTLNPGICCLPPNLPAVPSLSAHGTPTCQQAACKAPVAALAAAAASAHMPHSPVTQSASIAAVETAAAAGMHKMFTGTATSAPQRTSAPARPRSQWPSQLLCQLQARHSAPAIHNDIVPLAHWATESDHAFFAELDALMGLNLSTPTHYSSATNVGSGSIGSGCRLPSQPAFGCGSEGMRDLRMGVTGMGQAAMQMQRSNTHPLIAGSTTNLLSSGLGSGTITGPAASAQLLQMGTSGCGRSSVSGHSMMPPPRASLGAPAVPHNWCLNNHGNITALSSHDSVAAPSMSAPSQAATQERYMHQEYPQPQQMRVSDAGWLMDTAAAGKGAACMMEEEPGECAFLLDPIDRAAQRAVACRNHFLMHPTYVDHNEQPHTSSGASAGHLPPNTVLGTALWTSHRQSSTDASGWL